MTRWLLWLGLPVGIGVMIALVVHAGARDVLRVIGAAGPMLLWLVPFHALPLLLAARRESPASSAHCAHCARSARATPPAKSHSNRH